MEEKKIVADLMPEEMDIFDVGINREIDEFSPEEDERLYELSVYERELWDLGYKFVAGTDEVGRGPLAGPVTAAAVILPVGMKIAGVNDSKKLSAKKRLALENEIKDKSVAWAIASIFPEDIDKYNIEEAAKMAMEKAISLLPIAPEYVLVDAKTLKNLEIPQTPIIKGDAKSITIGAASIIAKCHRDRMMEKYDEVYPGYGLGKHAGYPTQAHRKAYYELGPSPIHRKTFKVKPVAEKK